MRHSGSNKRDALIHVMTDTYEKLRAIEAKYGLCVGGDDFRPRIEYFHDAVRVLTQRPDDMYLPRTRLSVEHLAYDLRWLRYLQDRPLSRLVYGGAAPRSAPQQAAPAAPAPLAITQHKPATSSRLPAGSLPMATAETTATTGKAVPPVTKAEISEHYRTYTVMYAALFAESADVNFNARLASHDEKVEDMAQIEQMIQMLEQGKLPPEQVEEAVMQIEDVGVRTHLMALLHQRSMKKRERFNAMREALKQAMDGVDRDSKAMDGAHMTFLSGQMMVYQEAKDLVRKLSGQGLAMAGKFLEEALSPSAGRGQSHIR